MLQYKSFEEFIADSGVNMTDADQIAKLSNIANRILLHSPLRIRQSEYGYTIESAHTNHIYSLEKTFLYPFRNKNVTWVDYKNNCILTILYEPSQYIGRPDTLIVLKEYLRTNTTLKFKKHESN